ncbi:MAG: hypothetical protein IK058_01865 [Bacteroidales bacterium]|nr:hypothetical protein [Bacteroidales bacterium]
MASHICGGFRRAENRPRIYAGSIARLQIDRAYMRGALHGCFGIPHLCGGRFTLQRVSHRFTSSGMTSELEVLRR